MYLSKLLQNETHFKAKIPARRRNTVRVFLPDVDPSGEALAAAGTTNFAGDVVELRRCLRTDSCDRSQTNNDDQSEHHCVLDGCWAIFRLQKTCYLRCEILHLSLPNVLLFPVDSTEQTKTRTTNDTFRNVSLRKNAEVNFADRRRFTFHTTRLTGVPRHHLSPRVSEGVRVNS